MKNNESFFDIGYEKGQIVAHDELCKRVHCGCMGGIRYSKDNNLLLVFLSENSKDYYNYWENGILYYMGMGAGNQSIDFSGNRRLADSLEKNTSVYLIERDSEQNYKFCGEVMLASKPFYKEITNQKGVNVRAVYFPLKFVD